MHYTCWAFLHTEEGLQGSLEVSSESTFAYPTRVQLSGDSIRGTLCGWLKSIFCASADRSMRCAALRRYVDAVQAVYQAFGRVTVWARQSTFWVRSPPVVRGMQITG
jgi:hypothetical protein